MDYVNMIVRGLSLMLNELYPEYPVYDYYPDQDLQVPCFVIDQVSTVKDRRIGIMGTKNVHGNGPRNLNYTYMRIIFYCPDQREIRRVTENVELALDEVMLEDGYPIHCYAVMSYPNRDYSLISFRVRYTTWVQPEPYIRMEELKMQENIENE